MRAVVVLAHPPLTEGSAAGRTGIALLRGLRAHGVDVQAIAANFDGPRDGPAPPPDLAVEVVDVDVDAGRAAGSPLHDYVHPRAFLGQGRFAARVAELAAGADLVHAEEADAAPALDGLSIPAVTHVHCLARRDRRMGAPWTSGARDLVKLARAESRVRRRSRWLLASSPEVAGDLQGGGADVTVIPMSLDPADYGPPGDAAPAVAGLIGSAHWPPTADAVRQLLTDVWPRVLEQRPDAVLRLAGREMARERFAGLPQPAGVEWVGPVASAEDFLRSLGLLLYPVARGSGTKVKVLEAMILGLPVVTTPSGAEGIAANEGVTVETDPARLAAAAASLLADPALRRQRGLAAREHFERHHAPEPATAPVVELYRRMLAAG